MFWEEEYHALRSREAWRQNQENELGAKIERLRAERDEAQRWYKEAISLREQNKKLLAALKVARQWMPGKHMTPEAIADCKVVDAALAKAEHPDDDGFIDNPDNQFG